MCLLRAAEASGTFLSRSRGRHAVTIDGSSGGGIGGGDDAGGERGLGGGEGEGAVALSAAWRLTWGTLLRADLRFSNPTVMCERGGVGEAVAAVLGACMRERLVDPGFVTKEQVRREGRGGGGGAVKRCFVWALDRHHVARPTLKHRETNDFVVAAHTRASWMTYNTMRALSKSILSIGSVICAKSLPNFP